MIDVALVVAIVQTGLTVSLIVLVGIALFGQGRIDSKASEILLHAKAIRGLEEGEMAALDEITANVERIETVGDSMKELLISIKAALDAAGTEPVALAALSASLGAKADEWVAATIANTPAAPPATP